MADLYLGRQINMANMLQFHYSIVKSWQYYKMKNLQISTQPIC